MNKSEILAFLQQQNLLTGVATAVRLKGGYWNDVFRITGDGFDWVAKLFRAGWTETLYPIMPDAEAKALALLGGKTAVSPTAIAYFPKTIANPAVLVYEFWPGKPWESGVASVADLLKRLHGVAPTADFRPMPTEPEAIMAQGDKLLDVIPQDQQGQQIRRLRPQRVGEVKAGARLKRPFLIHTDFGPGNMIDGPKGLRIIDWQCPGIGDPVEDVWSFLSPGLNILFHHAPLTPQEKSDFLQAYADEAILARLAWLSPSFSYRFACYCALRVANSPEAAVRAVYQQALTAEMALLERARLGDSARTIPHSL